MSVKRIPLRVAVPIVVAIAVPLLILPACQKREKPAPAGTTSGAPVVVKVELGTAVGADKRVVQPTTTFSPGDTIYAAVMTDGNAPSATLTARWSYQDGQLVDESTQTITMNGPATTEFHVVKPSGWPTGGYKLEILLNGAQARAAEFNVR